MFLRKKFEVKKKNSDEASVYRILWRRFLKSKLNVFFLFILTSAILIATLGYLISPDPTPFANQQFLELSLQKPGFSVTMLKVKNNSPVHQNGMFYKMLFGTNNEFTDIPVHQWNFSGDSLTVELFTGMNPNDGQIVQFHIADVISSLHPENNIQKNNNLLTWKTTDGHHVTKSISDMYNLIEKDNIREKRFRLGTDRFGRDVLSQLIIGARVSLSVGFISVIISLLIGVLIGSIAGYFSGRVDRFCMWLINVVWAIPTLFLVIAITFALGKGFWQIFIAVGLTLWVEIARLVRGLVMSIKSREFIEAAKALGYSDFRIIFHHILPSAMGPIIVVSASNFASAILIESGLSFLGIGIQPPMPSWGTMLRENYGFLIMDYGYLAVLPGLAIMLLVLTFMVLGNGIRDALDVKQLSA